MKQVERGARRGRESVIRWIGAGVLAVALATWADPSSAQTVRLTCTAASQLHLLSEGVVSEQSIPSGVHLVSVDLGGLTLTSGSEVAAAMITGTQIAAMRVTSENTTGYWLIDRSNGAYLRVSAARIDTRVVYGTARGQCQTIDGGATSF